MPSGADPVVVLPGPAMVGLVRAVAAMETAGLGRHAVVGGLAVCARLKQAHRATADVDTVVDETMPPDAVNALLLLDDTRPDPTANHRVYVSGTKVEILGVGPIGEEEDLSRATDADALFVRAHTWALDSAGPVRLVSGDDPAVHAAAPFATPGALVAMKLHAIEGRSTAGLDKRAGDAWDLYRILVDLDDDGAVRAELRGAPVPLRDLVAAAADRVLATGAADERLDADRRRCGRCGHSRRAPLCRASAARRSGLSRCCPARSAAPARMAGPWETSWAT